MIGIFVMIIVFVIILLTILAYAATATKVVPTNPQALFYQNFYDNQ